MAFKKQFVNFSVEPSGNTMNVRKLPNTTSEVVATVSKGSSAGRTTGSVLSMNDGEWFQVALSVSNVKYGYVRKDVMQLVKPASNATAESNAKGMVENLLKNDLQIAKNLAAVQKKYGSLSLTQKTNYILLKTNLINRQKLIQKNSGLLTVKKTTDNIISGIGEIITIALAVGFGIAIAATVYYAFKPSYDQSTSDLKVSSDLQAVIYKMNEDFPGRGDALKADLENQVDDAYNQGKNDGTFGGAFKIIKPLAWAGLGLWAGSKLLNTKSK